jgi:hypothetical protein
MTKDEKTMIEHVRETQIAAGRIEHNTTFNPPMKEPIAKAKNCLFVIRFPLATY